MALKYTLPTEPIKFNGGEMTVRGLTVPDISQLVLVHQEAATSIYDRFIGEDGSKLTEKTVDHLALEVLGKFPAAVAHLIALCGDEPELIADYARLPIDVQVAALEKIAILSFAMAGGLKNFVETVTRIAVSAGGLTKDLQKLKEIQT